MNNQFSFEIVHQSKKSKARAGIINTPHGQIKTPAFVAVGTNGTIKAVENNVLNKMEQDLIFCNTYHLMLQPGTKIVKNSGGLHQFINRPKPIITDSGGFQVFSLAYGSVCDELKSKGQKKYDSTVIKISEDGVTFRSYINGDKVVLTPETSIKAQKDLGADIIVTFDELPPYHVNQKKLKASVERTHRWEKRSLDEHLKNPNNQAIYTVIHGGLDRELRTESCKFANNLPFDGFAIGGSLGKNHEQLFDLVKFVTPQLEPERPIHLLGIGDLKSVIPCIELGIDTMDSSHPTRCARHGLAFTTQGAQKIVSIKNKNNFGPLDPNCSCSTCKNYSAAYIHHLFKAKELTAYTLATIHNVHFMIKYMKNLREKILEDKI
ncbi:tRNA-guanosine(34) transglycosylase [bacterium]|jgi:queuine tRNA-ribosyltransferase|nr:tRNA-guanosine(34) transglycosylase [bacterium]